MIELARVANSMLIFSVVETNKFDVNEIMGGK